MRFGMSGCFLPADMNDLTPELCRRVRALGFSGIFSRFRANDPLTTDREQAERARQLLADEGVALFQATGYWQLLIAEDETARREAVRVLQAALRLAGWLGARAIDTGPGSYHPAGPWWPHPANWTRTSRRQLMRSLRECASAAQDAGVYLSLEGHHNVTLESAEVTLAVLTAVDSPWVRCDYDSANWVSLQSAYDTAGLLNTHFDLLGEWIVSCHAKDIWPEEERFSLHLQDGCPGRGKVDFRMLFRRMEALSPDYPVIAEGNTTEELPAVSALFHGLAQELGLRVLDTGEHA
jgi:sugar phosphate isomerase/epimerase